MVSTVCMCIRMNWCFKIQFWNFRNGLFWVEVPDSRHTLSLNSRYISITWVSFSHPAWLQCGLSAMTFNARLSRFFKPERAWAWACRTLFMSAVLLAWGVGICLASVCRHLVACDHVSSLLESKFERLKRRDNECCTAIYLLTWSVVATWRGLNCIQYTQYAVSIPTKSDTSFMVVSWAFCPQHEPIEGQRWTPGKRICKGRNQGHRAASWEYFMFGANVVSLRAWEIGVAVSCSSFWCSLYSLFCRGVGILGGAGDTSFFTRHSLHAHSRLHPLARWRKKRSWRPKDLQQVAESQFSRFCTLSHGIHGTF